MLFRQAMHIFLSQLFHVWCRLRRWFISMHKLRHFNWLVDFRHLLNWSLILENLLTLSDLVGVFFVIVLSFLVVILLLIFVIIRRLLVELLEIKFRVNGSDYVLLVVFFFLRAFKRTVRWVLGHDSRIFLFYIVQIISWHLRLFDRIVKHHNCSLLNELLRLWLGESLVVTNLHQFK